MNRFLSKSDEWYFLPLAIIIVLFFICFLVVILGGLIGLMVSIAKLVVIAVVES